jgi:hypothetical protein
VMVMEVMMVEVEVEKSCGSGGVVMEVMMVEMEIGRE